MHSSWGKFDKLFNKFWRIGLTNPDVVKQAKTIREGPLNNQLVRRLNLMSSFRCFGNVTMQGSNIKNGAFSGT